MKINPFRCCMRPCKPNDRKVVPKMGNALEGGVLSTEKQQRRSKEEEVLGVRFNPMIHRSRMNGKYN